MNPYERITKEFMVWYLDTNSSVYESNKYIVVYCHTVWPWGNKLNRQYMFDKETHSLKHYTDYNQSNARYISRDSEEYKGFILFITTRELIG